MTAPDTPSDPLTFLRCPDCQLDNFGHADGCPALEPPEDWEEPPPSTPAERLDSLCRRAQEAQDRLGWADPQDHAEVTHATVDLARVVNDLTRELRTLAREVR